MPFTGIHLTSFHIKERYVFIIAFVAAGVIASVLGYIWIGLALVFWGFYSVFPDEEEIMANARAAQQHKLHARLKEIEAIIETSIAQKRPIDPGTLLTFLHSSGIPPEEAIGLLAQAMRMVPASAANKKVREDYEDTIRRIELKIT